MCFFKKYNDSHGHLAGDDALRAVANAMRQKSVATPDSAAAFYTADSCRLRFALLAMYTHHDGCRSVVNAFRDGFLPRH